MTWLWRPPRIGPAQRFEASLAALFGTYFAVAGILLPFLPLWMEGRGLTPVEIGLAWAVPLVVKTFSQPLIAYAVDRHGDRRRALILIALGAGLSAVGLHFSTGFAMILAVSACYSLMSSAIAPLSDVYAMSGVRAAGLSYGRMRLWGSIAFIGANVAGGWLVARTGNELVVPLMAAGMAVVALTAFRLPEELDKAALGQGKDEPVTVGGALRLLSAPAILLALTAAALLQASHATMYALGSVHWARLGIAADTIGMLWAIGVIAEIVLFIWSGPVVRRLGPVPLLAIAAAGAMLRWGLMTADPPVAALVAVQCLHGLTFGATHLATVHFISDRVPRRFGATAQGTFAALSSAIMGAGMFLSGFLYDGFAAGAYWAMAAAGAVALGISLMLMLRGGKGGRLRV